MSCLLKSIGRTCRFVFWTLPILLVDGLRLILFVVVLAPGFARFFWYYAVAANRASIKYGQDSCRQTLDIYLPRTWKSANEIKKQQRNNDSNTNNCLDPSEAIGEDSSAGPSLWCAPCSGERLLDNGDIEDSTATAATSHDSNSDNSNKNKAPVVIFFTGGAWLIGYKMWGSLLARALTAAGLIVVIPDYGNYPWSSVPTMVNVDVEQSIQWIVDNIKDYGGNVQEMILVGQSAGGHLLCTALLRKAIRMATGSIDHSNNNICASGTRRRSWQPTDFMGFISLSAPYDLRGMKRTFRKHGLDSDLVNRIFGCQMEAYEPSSLLQEYMTNISSSTSPEEHVGIDVENDSSMNQSSSSSAPRQHWSPLNLPPIRIYHGTRDQTVPVEGALEFANALGLAVLDGNDTAARLFTEEERVTYASYPDWSHTDAILECPMDANHRFHCDIFHAVQDWSTITRRALAATTNNNNMGGLEQQGCIIGTRRTQSLGPVSASDATTIDPRQQERQQQQQQQHQQALPPPLTTTTTTTTTTNIRADSGLEWPKDDHVIQHRLCPHILVKLGRWFNPF